jgi:hypothetical protein
VIPAEDRLRRTSGLCGHCVHAIIRATRRDTIYLRCGYAAVDETFPKYPRLPMQQCPAYRRAC